MFKSLLKIVINSFGRAEFPLIVGTPLMTFSNWVKISYNELSI